MLQQRTLSISGGSVPGRQHLCSEDSLIGINNHDAMIWHQRGDELAVAVVCDGVGGKPKGRPRRPALGGLGQRRHSEVGAKLGARLLLRHFLDNAGPLSAAMAERLSGGARDNSTSVLERIRRDLLAELRVIANLLKEPGGSFTQIVEDYLLFTAQVAVVTADSGVGVFGIGDGLYVLNGGMPCILEPAADNTPPVIAYGLIETEDFGDKPELLRFQVRELVPSAAFESLVLGTDGAAELLRCAGLPIPGGAGVVPALGELLDDPVFLRNGVRLQGLLNTLQNRSVSLAAAGGLCKEEPLLYDDTTVVIIKMATPQPPA